MQAIVLDTFGRMAMAVREQAAEHTARDSDLLFGLIQVALGYWRSQVLFAATELGIFDVLDGPELTAEEVARRCDAAVDYTERLLNACVALGLLKKGGAGFRNARLGELFLRKGSPRYMGAWVRLMSAWYAPWGRLRDAVRTGKPVEDPLAHLGGDVDYTRDFILAMHDYAMNVGRAMPAHLDLTGRRRLLDVGGGPGTYSVLLAQRFPQLSAVVFDLPAVIDIAQEVVAQYGLTDRIGFQQGDYLVDDLGEGFDVVLLSNVLHQEDSEVCRLLLRKAFRALRPGGLLVVQAMFLNANRDGPAWPTMHSLLLLLVYRGGRAYSADETLAMISQTGFVEAAVQRLSLLNAESLIVARKP